MTNSKYETENSISDYPGSDVKSYFLFSAFRSNEIQQRIFCRLALKNKMKNWTFPNRRYNACIQVCVHVKIRLNYWMCIDVTYYFYNFQLFLIRTIRTRFLFLKNMIYYSYIFIYIVDTFVCMIEHYWRLCLLKIIFKNKYIFFNRF